MNQYFEAIQEQKLSRCPHIIRRLAGDETYDLCEINTRSCLIEHGHYDCETWNEIQAEWIKEEHEIKAKPYPSCKIIKESK